MQSTYIQICIEHNKKSLGLCSFIMILDNHLIMEPADSFVRSKENMFKKDRKRTSKKHLRLNKCDRDELLMCN